jgi:vacuolar protein sorting-associated protein VTA1
MTYTTTLMDKLENFKLGNATNDAVHDDVAAQAYVEQFALETLSRAEKAMKANKVTA